MPFSLPAFLKEHPMKYLYAFCAGILFYYLLTFVLSFYGSILGDAIAKLLR